MRRAIAVFGVLVAILVAVAAWSGEPTSARAFELKFKSLADAAELVSPLLSPDGSVTLQPRLKTLVVQDHVAVLDQIRDLLASFDTPPRSVEVTLTLFIGTDRREQEAGRNVPPSSFTRDVRGVAEPLHAVALGRLGGIGRGVGVDDHHRPARRGDPRHLGQRGARVQEVVEGVARGSDREGVVRERQRHHVAPTPAHVGQAVLQLERPRPVEHRRGEVDAGDVAHDPGEAHTTFPPPQATSSTVSSGPSAE